MKRFFALFLCLLMCAALFACEGQTAVPLQIQDVSFSEGVYAYVLHEVLRDAKEDTDRETLLAEAERRCAVYAALESAVAAENVKLSAPLKSECAARVRGLWQFFSGHYRTLGVDKPDLTQIETWKAKEKALTLHLYGADGAKEVGEGKLKKWFRRDYVGYRGFYEPLTKQNANGEVTPLSEEETAELRQKLDALKKCADGGASLDRLYQDYSKEKGLLMAAEMDETVLKKGDPMATEDFFEKLHAMKNGAFAVLQNGTQLWLLQRIDLLAKDAPYFDRAHDDLLLSEKQPAVKAQLEAQAESLSAVSDAVLCSRIYERVRASASSVR